MAPVTCFDVPAAVPHLPPRPSQVDPVSIERLAETVGAGLAAGAGADGSAPSVRGVTLRAQHVRPRDLFAALPGNRVHGADFADEALDAGAVALLTDPVGGE